MQIPKGSGGGIAVPAKKSGRRGPVSLLAGEGLAPKRAASALARAAPPAGRAGVLPAARRTPGPTGATTWRACATATAGRASPGGAAAGREEPPRLALRLCELSPVAPEPGREERRPRCPASPLGCCQLDPIGATGSGPGTGRWKELPRNPEGALDAGASEPYTSILPFRSFPLLRTGRSRLWDRGAFPSQRTE